jgi:LAO/AO transport system kinase
VRETPTEQLVAGVLAGDRRSLARAISVVEDGDPAGRQLVSQLMPHTGTAMTIGITGPPGAGKSTLVSALVRAARADALTVGVVSVDPSSPFTQGAVLGDRIRLAEHFLDEHVFIRSMGTRGHSGGLAEATLQACLVLDAAGKDVVFVETVGAGQTEVEVRTIADLVVLVLMPGSGDSIQALKAGIMEIPDLVVLNKRDLEGVESALRDLRLVAGLDPEREPAVLTASALSAEGTDEVWAAVQACHETLESAGELADRRRRNLAAETFALAEAEVRRALDRGVREDVAMRELIRSVERREIDPATAASKLAGWLLEQDDGAPGDR